MTESLTMSVQEAAEQLGICTKTAYTLVNRADFPTIRIGRRIRISTEGLKRWIEQQEQANA